MERINHTTQLTPATPFRANHIKNSPPIIPIRKSNQSVPIDELSSSLLEMIAFLYNPRPENIAKLNKITPTNRSIMLKVVI